MIDEFKRKPFVGVKRKMETRLGHVQSHLAEKYSIKRENQ